MGKSIRIVSPVFLAFFSLQMAAGADSALDSIQYGNRFIRTAFTHANGLPLDVVHAVVQTRDGFLWVSTPMGLARFDGNHFLIPRFRPKRWTTTPSFALVEGPDGDLWNGTDDGVIRIPRTALDQPDISPVHYRLGSEVATNTINALHFSRNGVLWAGTADGLFRFDRGSFVAVVPKLKILRIEEAVNGNLLLVTGRGFAEWTGTQLAFEPELSALLGLGAGQIFHVYDDRAGNRWYCTAKGVARQTDGKIVRLQPFGAALKMDAYRVSEDAGGNVWLCLIGGLYRAGRTSLELVDKNPGARVAFPDRQGNLWLCTNGAGLIRFKDRPVRMFTSRDGLPNDVTMATLQTRDGKLWVGNNCGGISRLEGDRFQTYSEKDGLANSCITSLAEDERGNLWIGTFGGGIFRFRDGRFKQYSLADGLASNTVAQVFASRDGSLWIATGRGLSHMRDGNFRNYTKVDGLPRNSVVNVYEDKRGMILAATNSGISRLIGDRFVPLPPVPDASTYWLIGEDIHGEVYAAAHPMGTYRIAADGLVPTRPNFTIGMTQTQDVLGDFWFCGESLSRAAPDALRRWEKEPNAPPDHAELGIEDGLISTECNTGGFPGMAVTTDRKLWMATWQGLAMVDLSRLRRNYDKPSLYIEDIAVGQSRVPPGKGLELEPDTHHVELFFGAVELTSPEKIRFQYRLDGVDPGWLDADTNRKAIYTNFPLGTQRFHVRACNSDGIWDRDGISYSITQLPHYYETGLFRFSLAGTAMLLIVWAFRYRMGQMAMQMNARLNERMAERTRLAQDLHDTLLQTIHASSMMVHVAMEEPDNPRGTLTALETVANWLVRAASEARSSLYALRDSGTEIDDLATALGEVGAELTAGTPQEFRLAVEGKVRQVHPIVRQEIFQVGREAIRNACRHSQGSKVTVTLTYARGLTLRVGDNGQGMNRELADRGKEGHFGLRGMRERAGRVGGNLTVVTNVNAGTEVTLTVSGSGIFLDDTLFRRFFGRQAGLMTDRNSAER